MHDDAATQLFSSECVEILGLTMMHLPALWQHGPCCLGTENRWVSYWVFNSSQ